MGRNPKLLLALAGAAVFALGATPGAAQAASSGRTAAVQLEAGGQEAATTYCQGDTGYVVKRYGYTGCSSLWSEIQDCPWAESFVVAPAGTIWHAWPNSGGWKQMPNNGQATSMHNCYYNGNGQRQVEVEVLGAIWYSYYSGGWRGWYPY